MRRFNNLQRPCASEWAHRAVVALLQQGRTSGSPSPSLPGTRDPGVSSGIQDDCLLAP